ncbi:hypothetical protein COOONC_27165 [Cooperia oncophora]
MSLRVFDTCTGSFIASHGRLRSECCLVTDTWQVKISDHGTTSLREEDLLKKKRKHFQNIIHR